MNFLLNEAMFLRQVNWREFQMQMKNVKTELEDDFDEEKEQLCLLEKLTYIKLFVTFVIRE